MKSLPVGMFCLAMSVLAASSVRSEECCSQKLGITVTGQGEVRVVPDQALLRLRVVTSDKDLLVAKTRNDTNVATTLELLRRMRVKPERIRTGALDIDSQQVARENEKPLFLGYQVQKSISVVLDDLTIADELLTQVVKAGVNRVDGFSFTSSEPRKHMDEARALAIRAAREKAAALAAEIGQSIGRAVEISEDVEQPWRVASPSNFWAPGDDSNALNASGSFAAGQNTMTARVTVRFELR